MHTHALATYTVRVREQRTNKPLKLGAFHGRSAFVDVVEKFLVELKQHSRDDALKKLHRVTICERENDCLCGVITSGDYGYTADLVDVDSLEMSHQRAIGEAELLPFYFLLDAPRDSKRAVLMLQRVGPFGIYTPFSRLFMQFFGKQFPDHVVDIDPHIPVGVLTNLMNGTLKSVTLTKYVVPKDLSDAVAFEGNLEETAYLKTKIVARRGKVLEWPVWLRGKHKRSGLIEYPSRLNEIADRIQMEVELNGRKRTVDVRDPQHVAPYIVLGNDVIFGRDGHPTFPSIDAFAREVLGDLRGEFGEIP